MGTSKVACYCTSQKGSITRNSLGSSTRPAAGHPISLSHLPPLPSSAGMLLPPARHHQHHSAQQLQDLLQRPPPLCRPRLLLLLLHRLHHPQQPPSPAPSPCLCCGSCCCGGGGLHHALQSLGPCASHAPAAAAARRPPPARPPSGTHCTPTSPCPCCRHVPGPCCCGPHHLAGRARPCGPCPCSRLSDHAPLVRAVARPGLPPAAAPPLSYHSGPPCLCPRPCPCRGCALCCGCGCAVLACHAPCCGPRHVAVDLGSPAWLGCGCGWVICCGCCCVACWGESVVASRLRVACQPGCGSWRIASCNRAGVNETGPKQSYIQHTHSKSIIVTQDKRCREGVVCAQSLLEHCKL